MSNLKIEYDNDEGKDLSIDNLFSGKNKSNIDFTREEEIDTDLLYGFITNKDKMKSESDVESVKKTDRSDNENDNDNENGNDNDNDFSFEKNLFNNSPHNVSNTNNFLSDDENGNAETFKENHQGVPKSQSNSRDTSNKIRREKAFLLFQLKKLSEKGYNQSKDYNMDDNINDIKDEVSRIKKEIEIEKSIKLARQGLTLVTSLLETGNEQFSNITGVDLDGWSESINANIEDYDEVFEELYEKYHESVSMSPEIKLLLMVTGSAISFHLTKRMLGGGMAAPDIMNSLSNTMSGKPGGSMNGPSSEGIEEVLSKMKSNNRTVSLSSDSGSDIEVKIPLKKQRKKKLDL
jgi:hypothetical protein